MRECLNTRGLARQRERSQEEGNAGTVCGSEMGSECRWRDEGQGFNWRRATGSSSKDGTGVSGRGLVIGGQYADRRQFNRRGNRVTECGSDDTKRRVRTHGGLLRVEHEGKACTVVMQGDLTRGVCAGTCRSSCDANWSRARPRLLSTFQGAVMLDSSGIGLLVAASNSLARERGSIRVVNASTDIFQPAAKHATCRSPACKWSGRQGNGPWMTIC